MRDETALFLCSLLAQCDAFRQTACLTFTAIHPDGNHSCPSRHIPLGDSAAVNDAVERLDAANQSGWGGFVAVGLRRPKLGRWKRGSAENVVALPALFVDVDDPSPETLARLRAFRPTPSCIVQSGAGHHAYWWLDEPLTDIPTAQPILRALAAKLDGDSLSVAQSLRLVGSINTKPGRNDVRCRLIDLRDERFALADFMPLVERQLSAPATAPRDTQRRQRSFNRTLNPDLIAAVTDVFIQRGYQPHGDWLNGRCIYPEQHKHGDQHPSFGFNASTGYGYCHVCGTLLLKDLCAAFGIQPTTFGGLFQSYSKE